MSIWLIQVLSLARSKKNYSSPQNSSKETDNNIKKSKEDIMGAMLYQNFNVLIRGKQYMMVEFNFL